MSRSSETRASSFFSRQISASVSVSLADAFENFFFQEQREHWLTPKRSATSLTG